jgi:N-formylglutamate amidohydrolase
MRNFCMQDRNVEALPRPARADAATLTVARIKRYLLDIFQSDGGDGRLAQVAGGLVERCDLHAERSPFVSEVGE